MSHLHYFESNKVDAFLQHLSQIEESVNQIDIILLLKNMTLNQFLFFLDNETSIKLIDFLTRKKFFEKFSSIGFSFINLSSRLLTYFLHLKQGKYIFFFY
jgi:hypothetical protein